jgi:hypothetical protein
MSLIGMRIEGTKIVFEKYFDNVIDFVTQKCPTYLPNVIGYCFLVNNILKKVNEFLLKEKSDLITFIDEINIVSVNDTIFDYINSIETTIKKIQAVNSQKKVNLLSLKECTYLLSDFFKNYKNLEKYNNITNYNILIIFDITIEGTIDEPELKNKINYFIYNINNCAELSDVLKKLQENIKELNITKEKIIQNVSLIKYINKFINYIEYLTKKIKIIHEQYMINLDQIKKQTLEIKLEDEIQKQKIKTAEKVREQLQKELIETEEEEKKRKEQQKIYTQPQIQFNHGDLVRYNNRDATINKKNSDGTYNISYTSIATENASYNVNGSALSLIDSSTQKKTVPKTVPKTVLKIDSESDSVSVVKRKITIDELKPSKPVAQIVGYISQKPIGNSIIDKKQVIKTVPDDNKMSMESLHKKYPDLLKRTISDPLDEGLIEDIQRALPKGFKISKDTDKSTNLRRYISLKKFKIYIQTNENDILQKLNHCKDIINRITINIREDVYREAIYINYFDHNDVNIAHVSIHMDIQINTNTTKIFDFILKQTENTFHIRYHPNGIVRFSNETGTTDFEYTQKLYFQQKSSNDKSYLDVVSFYHSSDDTTKKLMECIILGLKKMFKDINLFDDRIRQDIPANMWGGNDKYYLKYLKYKQKYLELKNNL